MLAFDEDIKVDISSKDLRDIPSKLIQSKGRLELTPTAVNRIRVRVRSNDMAKNSPSSNLRSIIRPIWSQYQARTGTPKKSINRSNTPTRIKEEESSAPSFIIRKQSRDKFKELSQTSFSSMVKTAEVSRMISDQGNRGFLSTKAACDFIMNRINETSRLIDGKVFLKMFTRELHVRIMEIVERKKDERAQNEIQKLEYKFGRKVALLYDKSKRFTCIENASMWKQASIILMRTFKKAFTQYELEKLSRSFTYCNELQKVPPDRLQNLFDVPPLTLGNALYQEKSELNKIKNITTLKLYIYLTDSLADSLLFHVSTNIRSLLSNIKRIQLDKSEQNRVKNSLLELISIMNFDYKKHPLSQLGQAKGQKESILNIVRGEFHKRIDFQLVNVFLAFAFFKYYSTTRNLEKGYTIFVNSYEANKTAINDYLVCHSKYFCIRDQLNFYLEEPDRRDPELPNFRGKNFVQFLKELKKLESRLPYIYEFISQKYKKLLTVDEVKTMLKEVGEAALSLGDYSRGGKLFETYLFILDGIDRVEMHRMIQGASEKDDRVKAMLSLNRRYMRYNNRLARVCWEVKDYVKGLTFIMNNIFIFYNSLRLINQYDPNSKPTKKPNEVLLMDYETQKQAEGVKKYYRIKLIAFIEEWKLSVQYHSKYWGMVGAAPTQFKQSFFLACGEAISSTEELPFYTSTTFNEFIRRYTNLPSILDKGFDSKIKKAEDDLTLQKHEKALEMEYYFPTYMGDFDLHLIDNKVLEIIYMNERNKRVMIERGAEFLLQNAKGSRAETESHKSKVIKKLLKWEVLVYFELNFESDRLSNELYRHVLKSWFQVNNIGMVSFEQNVQYIIEDMSVQMRERVKAAFAAFSLKFRQFLKNKTEIAAKLKLRKFFKYADKFVHDSKLRKNQEIVNHIRVVESRPIAPSKMKPSRFQRERENQIEKVVLKGHLHNFSQWFKNSDLKVKKERRGSTSEGGDTPQDHLNCLINHRKFFEGELQRKVRELKMKLPKFKRSSTKVLISVEFQQMFDDFIQRQTGTPLMVETGQTLQILSSLKELQKNSYKIHWVDEFGGHLSYKSSVEIDNLQISFAGTMKTSRSKYEIPLRFDLKFSMDLFLYLESFLLSTKYHFTTIWPIVFDQIKTVYLADLYSLSKDQISSLPYLLRKDLVKFGQRQGFGFSLQYTTFDQPVNYIHQETHFLDNYRDRDAHALQIIINNLWVFVRVAELLVKRSRTGRRIASSTDIGRFSGLLRTNNINLTLWVFQRLRATRSYLDSQHIHVRWLLGSVEPVIPQPKQLAKDMIEFLSTLNVFLQFSMESNPAKPRQCSNVIYSRRIRAEFITTTTMELSIRLIFKVEELDRLIEIFKQLQLQGLSLNMSPSEFEKYTVYLLIALFDRIVEFELTWHSFVFEKAKQYKKNLEKSETTVLKMILMNLTCSAMKPKKQTVSFLQLYYLQMYKGEKLNGGPQDSWDFELRALKRKILDEASQRFRCGYDLDEAIDMNSSSLLLMFKGMMSDPYNCKYWRKMAQGLLRVSKTVLIAASAEIATVERLTHDLEANKRARYKWTFFALDGEALACAIDTQAKLLSSRFRGRIDRGRNEGSIYGLNNNKHISLANLLIKDPDNPLKCSSQISLLPMKRPSVHFEGQANSANKTTIKFAKKTGLVDTLFSKNFEEIVKSQKSQWRINLQKAKKISEVLDSKDSDTDQRKIVFSNTRKSSELMLKEYINYISKDLVRLVKSRESEVAYYLRFKKFQAKLKKEWRHGLGTDRSKIFEEFARGSKRTSDSKEMEVTIRKQYAYNRRNDDDSVRMFNLIMNFKYIEERVYFAVTSLKMMLNFPALSLNIKLEISEPTRVLLILRILKLSSEELQYRCFRAIFGLNKIGYFLSSQLKSFKEGMHPSSHATTKLNFVGVMKQGASVDQTMYKAETLLHAELRLLKIDGDSFQIDKSFMYGLLNKRTVRDIEESNHQLRGQYDAGHEVIQSFFKYNEGLDRPDVRLPHAKYASFKLQTKIGGVQFFQVKAHVFYMPVDTHLNDKDFLQQENPCQFQDKFYETIAARIQKQLLKLISKKKELSKAESDRQFEKFLEEHSLVNPHEMLIICFTFERRFSKISLHKLGLTWNDVKEFYSHDGFLLYMNKLDGSAEHSELLLHSLSLKSLFILFINYILSHCEHEKNILYKTIVIKIPRTLPNAVPQFLKNRWEKFKPSPSVASLKAMVRTTQNLTLVYSGVRRVLGSYFLIKVIKNRLLRQFQVVFYYQFTCRQFVFTLDPSDLGSVISVYLSSITRLILGFNRTKLPKDYQDFYHLLLQKDLIVSKKELASKSLIVRSTSSVITEEKSNQKPFKETSLKVININQNSQNRFKNKEFGAIPKKDKPKILVTSERGSIIEIKDQSIRRDSLNDGSKESSRQSSMENSLKDLWDYTSDLSSKEDLGQYLRHLSQQSRSTALLEFIKELEERTTFSCTVDDNFINNFDKTRKPSKRFIKVWNGIEAGLRKVKEFEDHLFWELVCNELEVSMKKQDGNLKFIICLAETQHRLTEYYTDPMAETEGDTAVPRWSYPIFEEMNLQTTLLSITDQETSEEGNSKEKKRDLFSIISSMPIIPLSLAHKIRLEASTVGVNLENNKTGVQQVNLMELAYLMMDEEKIGDWLRSKEYLNLSNLRQLAQYFLFKINNSVHFYQ